MTELSSASIFARTTAAGLVLPASHEGAAGTAPGINIAPGCADDGWVVPDPVTLADGTRLQLYKDGEALKAAFHAIESARVRICVEVYILRSDPTGRAFADLLCRKARDGVRVFLIYDSFGCSDTDPAIFEQMLRAGVRLAEFHPLKPWQCRFSWRPANRDHRKLLVIDDHIAGLGGINIGAEYAGSWVVPSPQTADIPWRDNAIGLVGPAAMPLLHSFARTWHYVNHGGRIRNAEFIHDLQAHAPSGRDGTLAVLASVPTVSSPLGPLLRDLMRQAQRSMQLTMSYFVPPDELITELCRAAARGVRVQLMLPSISDVKLLLSAGRSFYEELLTAGVEIHERQGAVLHAKTMCIDSQTSIIGSTNLDHRSIEFNLELSVLVRSREFGRQMNELFENDIRFARRINAAEWRHRPMWDRFVQWAVYRARYLL